MKNFTITVCFLFDCLTAFYFFAGSGNEFVAFWPMLAVAASSAFGLWDTYQKYETGKQQAELMDQEAETNAKAARMEVEDDARAQSDEVRRMRDQQRRRRATIEAMYAKSGVLLEGSAADILAQQSKVDEFNTGTALQSGNERRKRFLWQINNNLEQSKFQADSFRRANKFKAIAGVVNTGSQAATNFKTWSS